MEEELGGLLELVGVLGGQVVGGGALGAFLLYLGMALQILLKTLGHVLALGDDADSGGEVLQDFGHQQGVVGATEDDGVNLRILAHNLIDALLHEIVGTGGVGFIVLHQRHPEGTGHTADLDVGVQLLDLEVITLALDGSLGGEDAHVAALREAADDFGSGADDTQHPTVWVELGQVVLLDGAEGFG